MLEASVLARQITFLKNTPEPWILGGDWNVEPEEIESTPLLQTMRGTLVASGEATTNWGSELDFAVVNRGLSSVASASMTWDVPWKPHAALLMRLEGFETGWSGQRPPAFPKLATPEPPPAPTC